MQSQSATTGLAKVTDAVRFLQISRTKLYDMMKSGELPFVLIGRNRRIPWAAIHYLAVHGTTESLTSEPKPSGNS
ncbi:hypothetical protein C5Y96_03155 [Blastopirellula marina]|uniref:Helix-turn-helix domain-containing protein n=1 Tax=Blastopirellula marina TaxID=124 RepID=A0A2S8G413_9BACT|nr:MULTISPECIES: helix-turn-helix domain-containing protein [Pirellulaceae]PQO38884.1 hypothetical protein C5Y96_03155 [Blastopirellula marina]RCS55192.1 DNA-binding protein [Bremerella cremea]